MGYDEIVLDRSFNYSYLKRLFKDEKKSTVNFLGVFEHPL
jgi:hypothetical protein